MIVGQGHGNLNVGAADLEVLALGADTLVDAIVEKLYGTMKDFDAGRAKQTVELIVDRDTTAASNFTALLDDLWPRRSSNLAA